MFRGAREEGGFITRGIFGMAQNGIQGELVALDGKGVAGRADKGNATVAAYGQSAAGMAGFFRGRVTITSSLLVKEIFVDQITATKGTDWGAKLFRIDHPLDPASRTLSHASIESDSLKNLYDGVAVLDDCGRAWVRLPRWFEALNVDFRYQLTCIGDRAPVYIAHEIEQNRFQIAGGKAGMKVSWQVRGIRHDAYATAHPLQVEKDKPTTECGKYWNPQDVVSENSARGIVRYAAAR